MQHTGQEIRIKRQKFTTQIRRQHREDLLTKRRNISEGATQNKNSQVIQTQGTTNSKYHILDKRFQQKIRQFHNLATNKQQFIAYIMALNDQDILKQHFGLISVRKLLTGNQPPIQQVIDAGLIPKLIAYARQSQYPQLQLEAVWCLTNVASGSNAQTGPIIQRGGIAVFVELLLSGHVGIVEQAVWVLGNIARDSPTYRDKIIKEGGLKNLIKVFQVAVGQLPKNPNIRQIIQSCTWTLSGICQTQPSPPYMTIKQCLPIFFQAVNNQLVTDNSILYSVCFAISAYTNKTRQNQRKIDKIQNCIDSGVLVKIVQFLEHPFDNIVIASLKILGSVASGTFQQARYLIGIGVLDKLQKLLYKSKKIFRRETCWVLSNITASSMQEIEPVLSRQTLVNKLLQILAQDDNSVRSQACYIFANAAQQGTLEKMFKFYIQINFIKILAENLMIDDKNLLFATLQCMESLLNLGNKIISNQKLNGGSQSKAMINNQNKINNYFVKELYKLNMMSRLEELQYHEQDKIYEIVAKIITHYFQLEDPLNA